MAPKRSVHFRQLPENEQINRLQARAAALQARALQKRVGKMLNEKPQHVHAVVRLLETLTSVSLACDGAPGQQETSATAAPVLTTAPFGLENVAAPAASAALPPSGVRALALTDGGLALEADPDGEFAGLRGCRQGVHTAPAHPPNTPQVAWQGKETAQPSHMLLGGAEEHERLDERRCFQRCSGADVVCGSRFLYC